MVAPRSVLVWALFLGGCPDPPPPSAQCYADPSLSGGADAGTRQGVALQVGHGMGSAFQAYGLRESVDLVSGSQGGYMVTPTLRLTGVTQVPEDGCIETLIKQSFEDGTVPAGGDYQAGSRFEKVGDAYVSLTLYDMLDYSPSKLTGQTLLMDVRVTGPDFVATSAATVTIR